MMKQFEFSKNFRTSRQVILITYNHISVINIENARIKIKIGTKILKKIPGNFKNHYKNVQNDLKCDFCVKEMTQNQCISCTGRKESRKGLDMSNLDDLVTYFKTILGENSQR